uniref:Sugar phosphate transporter domain-containing protein n=1 Tax=Chromera velia CCMP2878 TaxID=1169474 RepID=A0A0G4H1E7_9ALVE|eukprot:Cvel_810.t1-p1 / transcript=Cvel_810.t1 / gene=Cvel_810 / organism=Chromera_velia_CCMP2878 / gene_product=Solute carrier family 35 member E3, putative / transcript_product=Solute carrier family 35 member E3, putative / location=Cvel_scaffold25:84864-87741(+) / protein_length=300 / sequence_SO=supercontig / SO=protein_coding / is_pseudo=false
MLGLFSHKSISWFEVVPISLSFCGFVVFNNLSLQYNTVGLYQLTKVMTTPTIVAIDFFYYHRTLPFWQNISLIPIIIGVILATVTDLSVNFWGVVFGACGVLSTSFYQIWVKTEQKRLDCNAPQLLAYQSPVSCLFLLCAMPFLEDLSSPEAGLFFFEWTTDATLYLFGSAFCAYLVNLSIFLVIGKTSAISYNVLGHCKTVAVLLSGWVLFAEPINAHGLLGVLLTLFGIIWYTHLKLSPAASPPSGQGKDKEVTPIGRRDNELEKGEVELSDITTEAEDHPLKGKVDAGPEERRASVN